MKKETLYELQKEMEKHLGDGWHLAVTKEQTIDGRKDTISCRFGDDGRAVLVYPSEYEKILGKEASIPEAGQFLASLVEDRRAIALTAPVTEEEFRKGLYIQVANAEIRKDTLKDMVYDEVAGDIVGIARSRGKVTEEGQVSILVTRDVMQHYHMSRGEIMELAYKNTRNQEFKLDTISHMLQEILEQGGTPKEVAEAMMPPYEMGIYVLTTKDRMNGANAIVCPEVLRTAYENMGEPYYVLPSSVHEVLLVRKSAALPLDEMTELVQSVNRQEVSAKDLLSNRVFYYNGKKLMPAVEEVKKASEALEKARHHKAFH